MLHTNFRLKNRYRGDDENKDEGGGGWRGATGCKETQKCDDGKDISRWKGGKKKGGKRKEKPVVAAP